MPTSIFALPYSIVGGFGEFKNTLPTTIFAIPYSVFCFRPLFFKKKRFFVEKTLSEASQELFGTFFGSFRPSEGSRGFPQGPPGTPTEIKKAFKSGFKET